jgi:modulator of drug activity B
MNILLINAHKLYPTAKGLLNKTMFEEIKQFFNTENLRETIIEQGYDSEEEVEKHLWADAIIIQSPIYWFNAPWIFKKYIEDVFTAGYGKMCTSDGRTMSNPNAQYGTGGNLEGKKVMLSVTYNAPREAFGDKNQFAFKGMTVDEALSSIINAYRFFGLEAIPTFACFDVIKNPQIESYKEELKSHLQKHFAGLI